MFLFSKTCAFVRPESTLQWSKMFIEKNSFQCVCSLSKMNMCVCVCPSVLHTSLFGFIVFNLLFSLSIYFRCSIDFYTFLLHPSSYFSFVSMFCLSLFPLHSIETWMCLDLRIVDTFVNYSIEYSTQFYVVIVKSDVALLSPDLCLHLLLLLRVCRKNTMHV